MVTMHLVARAHRIHELIIFAWSTVNKIELDKR